MNESFSPLRNSTTIMLMQDKSEVMSYFQCVASGVIGPQGPGIK